MPSRCLLFALLLTACTLVPLNLHATTYYVDSTRGADDRSGTTDATSWKTLRHVNTDHFKPGDRILFKYGSTWHEQLAPASSGSEGKPIILDAYGATIQADPPHMVGDQLHPDAVLLHNVQNIELHHLDISNAGDGHAVRRGVHVFLENFGTAHHIVLADLYIHDVYGNDTKDSAGILFHTQGDKLPTCFDGLLIERNIVWKVDRSGIFGQSDQIMRDHWYPSLHVVLRDNYVEDTGGDGIVPIGTDAALVEGNVVRKASQRSAGYNAGIWEWGADNTVLRLNEALETGGTKDGEGFDSDYNSRNTLFEFNYGHDNTGGFLLICSPGKRESPAIAGNTGTIVRYNIAHDNRNRLINLNAAENVLVERNAFYTGGHDVQMLVSNWEGWPHNATFRGNLFVAQTGTVIFGHATVGHPNGQFDIAPGWLPAEGIVYTGNTYIGTIADGPEDSHAHALADPSALPAPRLPTLDWSRLNSSEPHFDPSQPRNYPAYVIAHRAWMIELFHHQFGGTVTISRIPQ